MLIVGKEPGGSKVGKARSVGCTLMSLHDVRKGLVVGNLAAISDGQAPMAIMSFSTGYRGNGVGHAIKAPPPPPKPAPPAARKPKQSSAKVASAAVMEDETKDEPPASRKASASKARPAMKNAEGKGTQKVLSPCQSHRLHAHRRVLHLISVLRGALRRRPSLRSARRPPTFGLPSSPSPRPRSSAPPPKARSRS